MTSSAKCLPLITSCLKDRFPWLKHDREAFYFPEFSIFLLSWLYVLSLCELWLNTYSHHTLLGMEVTNTNINKRHCSLEAHPLQRDRCVYRHLWSYRINAMLEICLGTMATYKEDNNHILAKWDREDFREKYQVFRVNQVFKRKLKLDYEWWKRRCPERESSTCKDKRVGALRKPKRSWCGWAWSVQERWGHWESRGHRDWVMKGLSLYTKVLDFALKILITMPHYTETTDGSFSSNKIYPQRNIVKLTQRMPWDTFGDGLGSSWFPKATTPTISLFLT